MKPKYLVGAGLAVAALVVAFFTLNTKQIDYATFTRAAATGRVVQVKGTWVKEMPTSYEHNVFTFFMRDDSARVARVTFDGGKPNNFEIAREIVCRGRVVGSEFHASEILTKCPSKYQGTAEEVTK